MTCLNCNKEINKFYFCDFVFPKIHLIIELDGSHHKNRNLLDKERDEYITRIRKYEIFRITQTDYQKGIWIDFIKEKLEPLAGLEPTLSSYAPIA